MTVLFIVILIAVCLGIFLMLAEWFLDEADKE